MSRSISSGNLISMHHHHTDHTYTNNTQHHHYPHSYHPQTYHSHHYQRESQQYLRSRTTSDQYHSSSHSTQIPKFAFQKPSPVEHISHVLPPILHPQSKSSYVDLNNRQPTPRNSSYHYTSTSSPSPSYGLKPSSSQYTSRPSSSFFNSYKTRIVSPTSRASDLAKYAMTKDEKPTVDSDGVARHRSLSNTSISPNEEVISLPSLSSPARNSLSIDVELSRKRKEREGEDNSLLSPTTPDSNASFLMTPKFGPSDEPSNQKRRLSIIEHLALKEDDKDFKLNPLISIKGEEPFSWYKDSYDLSNYPIPHQEPITVFPVQYGIYQPNQNTNGTDQQVGQQQQQQGNETPNTLAAQTNNNSIPLDPTLSSMRSSVAPNSNGSQNSNQNQNQNQINIDPTLNTPEIRFPDAETLASATASPSRDNNNIPNDANTQAALASISQTPTLTVEDAAALLSAPQVSGSGGEGSNNNKKEQPFSRSPELRVSHKLAERKRRKEMKELFDELRDELPSDRGMKASKWEILSKAIDHCRQLKLNQEQMVREIDHLRREVDIARGGTGAYTHAYPTYNLAGTYPPTTNYTNTTTAATGTTGQQPVQPVQNVQTQQPQQTQQVQPQTQQTQVPQQPQQTQQQPQQQQQQQQNQQQQQQIQPIDQIEAMAVDIKSDGIQPTTQ